MIENSVLYSVTSLCLIYMAAIVVATCAKLLSSDREKRLKALKNFKKGKFALIYFAAIPLFWIGIIYKGTPVGGALLLAIKSSVDLVVLKFDYSSVAALMNADVFYCATFVICFVLVVLNAATFAFTLFAKKITNYFRKFFVLHSSDNVYAVIGYNEQNVSVIKSVLKSGGKAVLFAEITPEIADKTFVLKVPTINYAYGKDLGEKVKKVFGDFTKREVNVIINSGSDATNLILVKQLNDVISGLKLEDFVIDDNKGLNVYVFGDPVNESSYVHFEEKSKGCVHYVNKYKLIAMDFVEKYPLTKFMDGRHIDYENAALKENTDVNVIMIGYGKTAQQLFLTSVANNQFMTVSDGNLKAKPVNYFIYDKENTQNDKNLNHNYFRYANAYNALKLNGKDYLELPEKPAEEKFYKLDINDTRFYKSLMRNLSGKEENTQFNYVIIAFGTDMENLDLAEKISVKLKEWGNVRNTKLFVKIRDNSFIKQVVDGEFAKASGFTVFGNESEVVYEISQIVNQKSSVMAKGRHLCYELEDNRNQTSETDVRRLAARKWYEDWTQVQRESNVYACLSVRLKLNLIGFDYQPKNADSADRSELFNRRYQKDDAIVYEDAPPVQGKRSVDYDDCSFGKPTLRRNLAVQEHQRWNAYMFTNGYIPASKNDIVKYAQLMNVKPKENQIGDPEFDKNAFKREMLTRRKHFNLTTFEGLKEYRDIVCKATGCSERDADVIKYDYQIMDDVCWLLDKYGYKIVEKETNDAGKNA